MGRDGAGKGARRGKGEQGREGRGQGLALVSRGSESLSLPPIALLLSTGHILNEPWDGRCHRLLDRPWEEADL